MKRLFVSLIFIAFVLFCFGLPQIILVSAGIAIIAVGLKFEIPPISFLKSLRNVSGRTLGYVVAISAVLFLFLDLLLGRFYPKVHTPTKYGWTVAADNESRKKQYKIQKETIGRLLTGILHMVLSDGRQATETSPVCW